MIIYLDQMFLENFIMNYIILYITAKMCKIEYKRLKLSAGASLGAIYVISSYAFLFYHEPMIILKILLSITMVFTSFSPKNKKIFFRLLGWFYIITFFIGGVSFGLAYFLNAFMIKEGGILYIQEFPVILVVIGTLISYIIGKYAVTYVKNNLDINKLIYKVRIKLDEKEIELNALYDSGHSVTEPFTNHPVVIIEKECLMGIVSEEIFDKINKNNFDFEEKWQRRLRIIPISTISSEKEVLAGFKTDQFVIFVDNEECIIENVIVAMCDKKLSKDNRFKALLGRGCMQK